MRGDTSKGAYASATVYAMAEMAKAYDLNIYKYLKYLLDRLPSTKMTDEALGHLTSWNPDVIVNRTGVM